MKREDVYKLIDSEREYQKKSLINIEEQDKKQSVSNWLLYIEHQVDKAKQSIYYARQEVVLHRIRKIAALAVACMENNETKPR